MPSTSNVWATQTASPNAGQADLGVFAEAMGKCGVFDARLADAASALERELAKGGDLAQTSEVLRTVGAPYVWPRVWMATTKSAPEGATFEAKDLAARIEKWRAGMPTSGERRCGTNGRKGDERKERLIFITVDALADLEAPLPVRSHAGSWLDLNAKLLVPASGGRVVVVGPDGRPRAVPTSTDQGRIRARFAPDRPGRFAVQVLADVGAGPRPLLEAIVFADVEPFESKDGAPGESAGQGTNDEAAMVRMVLALRNELGLPPLRRDPGLDALAREHALRMKAKGRVGHDVGDGDPKTRIERSNVVAKKAGENVAHAESVVHAHRALYTSPSHRANLVHTEFDRFGLAVVQDPDGSVWVAQLFAR